MTRHERAIASMKLFFIRKELDRICEAKNRIIRIDLHGMSCSDARRFLNNVINVLQESGILQIIHGCNQGTVLQNMIRNDYTNNHIKTMILNSKNNGVTYLQIELIVLK